MSRRVPRPAPHHSSEARWIQSSQPVWSLHGVCEDRWWGTAARPSAEVCHRTCSPTQRVEGWTYIECFVGISRSYRSAARIAGPTSTQSVPVVPVHQRQTAYTLSLGAAPSNPAMLMPPPPAPAPRPVVATSSGALYPSYPHPGANIVQRPTMSGYYAAPPVTPSEQAMQYRIINNPIVRNNISAANAAALGMYWDGHVNGYAGAAASPAPSSTNSAPFASPQSQYGSVSPAFLPVHPSQTVPAAQFQGVSTTRSENLPLPIQDWDAHTYGRHRHPSSASAPSDRYAILDARSDIEGLVGNTYTSALPNPPRKRPRADAEEDQPSVALSPLFSPDLLREPAHDVDTESEPGFGLEQDPEREDEDDDVERESSISLASDDEQLDYGEPDDELDARGHSEAPSATPSEEVEHHSVNVLDIVVGSSLSGGNSHFERSTTEAGPAAGASTDSLVADTSTTTVVPAPESRGDDAGRRIWKGQPGVGITHAMRRLSTSWQARHE